MCRYGTGDGPATVTWGGLHRVASGAIVAKANIGGTRNGDEESGEETSGEEESSIEEACEEESWQEEIAIAARLRGLASRPTVREPGSAPELGARCEKAGGAKARSAIHSSIL